MNAAIHSTAINIIDEQIRRSFESDWLRGSRGDIADYLPTPDDPSFLATLEELICIDLEFRWRQLTPSDAQAVTISANALTLAARPAVEDYLDRFPQLKTPAILQRLIDQEIWARKNSPFPPSAEEFQQRFPQLGLPPSTVDRILFDPDAETIPIGQASTFAGDVAYPRAFGKYELLGLLGRGGMGMVYRARQAKAEREVAIKTSNCNSFPLGLRQRIRHRFESEVRAAAKLSHPNLMPVFDVGEVDGCLYYTMPIVAGDLAAELRKQPLSNARAARYLAQAAQGLAAAHQQGLLHRDIKPHNLMVDREHDRILVADFGLARLTACDQQLTRSGEIIGTPPYMSPEQIRDPRAIDARADVYALGATLYHLLAGRPPFQAATPTETLRQVLDDDPVSPRLINPQVDRDLETICLRCLQKDPQLRFASASELADDLNRFGRGEPIVSRPLNLWGRLVRWRRRNPIVASLTAGLAGSLLLIATIAILGWYSTQRQLARVVANSRQGQSALNELFTFVRTEPLLDQPGQESIREYLLDHGLKHYESLIELSEENETLPADLLAARKELGLLALELHGPNAASQQFRQVIAAVAQLPLERQRSSAVQETLGDSWNGLGQAQNRLGLKADALTAFDRAISIRKEIVRTVGDNPEARNPEARNPEARRKLANAMMNHALVEAATGHVDKSRAQQEDAQRQRRQLLAADDTKATADTQAADDIKAANDAKLRRDVAQGEFNLARLDLTNDQRKAGLTRLHDATQQFQQLTRDFPTDARIWQRYIECLLTLSMFDDAATLPTDVASGSSPPQQTTTSKSYAQQAIDYLQPLSSLAPTNRTYRLSLIELYQQAIEQLLAKGRAADAEEPWQTMQTQLIDRLDIGDTQPDATRVRLVALRQRGLISLGTGKNAQAKQQLQIAIAAWHAAKQQATGSPFRDPAWVSDWTALEKLAASL